MFHWIPESAVIAIHAELLAEHGGVEGITNEKLIGATLARAQQLLAYSNPAPDVFRLAAAHGFGFAKNHCFTDGNKRVALSMIDVFLEMNGYELTANEPETVTVILSLATSEIDEEELTEWIRKNSQPFDINKE